MAIETKMWCGREQRLGIESWTPFSNGERVLIVLGAFACGMVIVGVSRLFGIPKEPHFNGSLLTSGSAPIGLLSVMLGIAICMALGIVIAALVNRETSLFCCCIGLAAFAVRCGSIRPVLQYAVGKTTFLALAFESIMLGLFLIGGWFLLQWLFSRFESAKPAHYQHAAPNEDVDSTTGQKFLTLLVQVVVMALVEQIIMQTDAPAQAMAGVLIGAFTGAVAAYMFTPLSVGIWYWTGPIALAAIAELLAFFSSPAQTQGDLTGWSGALARATPLVYASMGTAGALLGYWCSRRWAQPEVEIEDQNMLPLSSSPVEPASL